MTVTPIQMARLANSRRHLAELLEANGCTYPEEAARRVIDELRTLGWTPPGWHDDDEMPRPGTGGSPEARQAAREATAAAVRAAREKRTQAIADARRHHQETP